MSTDDQRPDPTDQPDDAILGTGPGTGAGATQVFPTDDTARVDPVDAGDKPGPAPASSSGPDWVAAQAGATADAGGAPGGLGGSGGSFGPAGPGAPGGPGGGGPPTASGAPLPPAGGPASTMRRVWGSTGGKVAVVAVAAALVLGVLGALGAAVALGRYAGTHSSQAGQGWGQGRQQGRGMDRDGDGWGRHGGTGRDGNGMGRGRGGSDQNGMGQNGMGQDRRGWGSGDPNEGTPDQSIPGQSLPSQGDTGDDAVQGLLHGEATLTINGQPTQVYLQTGQVTTWTPGAKLAVRSSDGHTGSYTVNASTAVVGAPAVGSTVRVVALKDGALALRIVVR